MGHDSHWESTTINDTSTEANIVRMVVKKKKGGKEEQDYWKAQP